MIPQSKQQLLLKLCGTTGVYENILLLYNLTIFIQCSHKIISLEQVSTQADGHEV